MTVSVILPIRNEAPFIGEVLQAVLQQDYPRDRLEIIVADGLSEDGTRDIVSAVGRRDSRVRLLDNPERITPTGLNVAIRAARGALITRVDGHGVLPPDYISECVAQLLKAEEASGFLSPSGRDIPSTLNPQLATSPRTPVWSPGVSRSGEWDGRPSDPTLLGEPAEAGTPNNGLLGFGGSKRGDSFRQFSPLLSVGGAWNCVGCGSVGQAIALVTSSRFGVGNAQYRTCETGDLPRLTDSVPFWVVRREVFERIGLFREEMVCHEDYDLNYRLRKAGGRILLLPWLRSKYYVRPTLIALGRQYGRYGFWKGRFLRSCPESLKCRHLVPPLFVALLTGLLIAAVFAAPARLGLGALIGTYLGYLLLATVILALSRNHGHPPRPSDNARPCPSASQPSTLNSQPVLPLLLAPLIPAVLVTLHFSWGIGVWWGLLRGPVPGQPPRL